MNFVSDPTPSLRWLFVDMNSFFASCEQQQNPTLRGKPVVIAPVMTDSTCAIAASFEAKALGIRTGTPIWEARKICPTLQVVASRPRLYVEYHHKIAEAIDGCIPVEAVLSIDEMACRLDRLQALPENAHALATQIKERLREKVGAFLTCSIGVASNRLLAKLASDMIKPNGLVILEPRQMPQPILHLKPGDICGVGRQMAERLRQAGIFDMTSLWNADAQRLRTIWGGVMGARFHALLHGADLPSPINPRRSMGHQHVLAPAERTREAAVGVMRDLLVRAAARVRREGFYARRLCIDIKWSQDLGYYTDEISFNECNETGRLLTHLTRLWTDVPQSKPHRIGVTLADLVAASSHQTDLFETVKPIKLTKAIDQINEKFGRGTLNFGTVSRTMESKIAFQRVPRMHEF